MNQPVSSIVQVVASTPEENTIIEPYSPEPPKVSPVLSKVQILSSHVEVYSEPPAPQLKPSTTNSPLASAAPLQPKVSIVTNVEIQEEKSVIVAPVVIVSSHVEVKEEPSVIVVSSNEPAVEDQPAIILSSIVEIHSSDDVEPVLQVENNIGEPEYDFLSRQPSEFAEETYRVHNIRPSNAKQHKVRSTATEPKKPNSSKQDNHPTGLVTKLGGTVVKDGATTVHETSVIGTYISGKYAQVLQSTSHIFHNNAKPKIVPSSSLRILKTAAPHVPKHKQNIEPTPAKQQPTDTNNLPIDELYGNSPSPNLVRSSRRPATSSGSFKNRFRNRNPKDDLQDYQEITAPDIQSTQTFNSPKKSRANKSKK